MSEIALTDAERRRGTDSLANGQPLTAMDCAMLSVNQVFEDRTGSGFETQSLLWLDGRADVARLRAGIERFCKKYPVATARLEGNGVSGTPCWRFRPDARGALTEIELASDDSQVVLDQAARLSVAPRNLSESDPLRFYLLHRPGGDDVFIAQYNHTLLDNNGAVPVLRELSEHVDDDSDDDALPVRESNDLIAGYLARFPRKKRIGAVRNVLNLRYRTLRGRPVMLSRPDSASSSSAHYRFELKSVDDNQTAALTDRVIGATGFRSLSFAILTSLFRAMAHIVPEEFQQGRNFIGGFGVDLGLRGRSGPLFRNLMSVVPIRVRREQTGDWESLLQTISGEFRDRLEHRVDLGVLQLAYWTRRRRRLARWLIRRLMTGGYSLWYAYFGSLDGIGERFAGAEIEKAHFTAPAWSPLGLTMLVNQHRGRLLFQISTVPDCVPAEVSDELWSFLVGDLFSTQ